MYHLRVTALNSKSSRAGHGFQIPAEHCLATNVNVSEQLSQKKVREWPGSPSRNWLHFLEVLSRRNVNPGYLGLIDM